MYKKIIITFIVTALFLSPVAQAKKKEGGSVINVTGIIKAIAATYGVNLEQLELAEKQFKEIQKQYEMYEKQLESMQGSKDALTGKNNFGWMDAKTSAKAWLGDENNINSLLDAYNKRQGQFGRLAQSHEEEFPIESTLFNEGNYTKRDVSYHALSSKTALSTRTASEIEFNSIDSKIEAQESLQKKIGTTEDVKASIDLLARMQAESNKIMLENLRMTALMAQQAAISEQGQVNARVSNAKFLTTK